ncbi:MAG: hypothetical protein J6W45_07675, partial [Bacteroidales bacterium]|nr:hypothetical protein [Bacteroidales bacterium]
LTMDCGAIGRLVSMVAGHGEFRKKLWILQYKLHIPMKDGVGALVVSWPKNLTMYGISVSNSTIRMWTPK